MNHFKKIAIIGAGNMGSAIAASLTDSPACMVLTAASQRTLQHAGELCPGAVCTTSNVEAVTDADLIFLCVKPFIAPEVFEEIRHHIMPGATSRSNSTAPPKICGYSVPYRTPLSVWGKAPHS